VWGGGPIWQACIYWRPRPAQSCPLPLPHCFLVWLPLRKTLIIIKRLVSVVSPLPWTVVWFIFATCIFHFMSLLFRSKSGPSKTFWSITKRSTTPTSWSWWSAPPEVPWPPPPGTNTNGEEPLHADKERTSSAVRVAIAQQRARFGLAMFFMPSVRVSASASTAPDTGETHGPGIRRMGPRQMFARPRRSFLAREFLFFMSMVTKVKSRTTRAFQSPFFFFGGNVSLLWENENKSKRLSPNKCDVKVAK